MRIGFFGGSFDPIHIGHIQLAQAAQRQLKLKKVYFVPARQSPLKKSKPLVSNQGRLAMVKLALKKYGWAKVGTWDLKRRGRSYTVTTLRQFRKTHKRDDLFFILGSDLLGQLHRWKNPNLIRKWTTLVIGRRPGSRKMKKMKNAVILKGTFPDISSTELKKLLKNQKKTRRFLPPSVARYIQQRNLYR